MKSAIAFLTIFLFFVGCGVFLCFASGTPWGTRGFGTLIGYLMIPGVVIGAFAALAIGDRR